ncbi:MAG: FAD-dependent monooxygenase [Acidobacteria bacterium]|nr:FAD-dependent monooxygenase [Acidobacteriota bacterium]
MRDEAVVLGASMGGMLAARALANHFSRVTVIERDSLPQEATGRRGVPQGRHAHGLLASGAGVLERFFPGFQRQLVERGAVPGDLIRDARWFHGGGFHTRERGGIEGFLASRPLIETLVCERLRALPNLRILENTTALGPVADEARSQVQGVRVRHAGEERVLSADLVVDATGRGSRSARWLEGLGYQSAVVDEVKVEIGYTTLICTRKPQHLEGAVAAILSPDPVTQRGGVILAMEDNRWIITMVGYFGNYAPTDMAGFRAFAQSLECPDIHNVLSDCEPLTEPLAMRYPASRRARYEKVRRFPNGYLVFGDAISSFNPIYGQGMSVSALEAEALDACLLIGDGNLAERFFRRAAAIIDIPWSIAVGNDLRIPQVEGPRNARVRFINWYMSKLHKAAHHDPEVVMAFQKVANLLAPPPSVMAPSIAWRVLKGNLFPSSVLPFGAVRSGV